MFRVVTRSYLKIVPPDFVMKALGDNAELLPSFIRSACKQLQVDQAEFGFQFP
jgi:hypothetical protein